MRFSKGSHQRIFTRPAGVIVLLVLLLALGGCQPTTPEAPERVDVWSQRGLMPGQVIKPRAGVVDDQGLLYVVDMKAMINVFDANGQFLRHWKSPDKTNGRPSGLGLDREGNILVADSHYHRILVYTPHGELVRTVGGDTGDNPAVGHFGYIGDVAVDSAGDWYVAEAMDNERITKLDKEGRIIKVWGSRGSEPGQFQRARALLVNSRDEIIVADACNHRLQVFDSNGRLLRLIGKPGNQPGQFSYPYDLALAENDDLLVVEYGNHRVQRFTVEGTYIGQWGAAGHAIGQLWNPWGIAATRQNRVYVIDSNNHRIQAFTW